MSATDYITGQTGPTWYEVWLRKEKAVALARKAMRTELENREHICGLIQKAIEDDNIAAANWLRGHLTKAEVDNG